MRLPFGDQAAELPRVSSVCWLPSWFINHRSEVLRGSPGARFRLLSNTILPFPSRERAPPKLASILCALVGQVRRRTFVPSGFIEKLSTPGTPSSGLQRVLPNTIVGMDVFEPLHTIVDTGVFEPSHMHSSAHAGVWTATVKSSNTVACLFMAFLLRWRMFLAARRSLSERGRNYFRVPEEDSGPTRL